jgi:hypothetical protein
MDASKISRGKVEKQKKAVGQTSTSCETTENNACPLYFPHGSLLSTPLKDQHQDDSSSSGYAASSSSYSDRSSRCSSPSSIPSFSSASSSSGDYGLDELEESYLSSKLQARLHNSPVAQPVQRSDLFQVAITRNAPSPAQAKDDSSSSSGQESALNLYGKSPIFSVGSDVMVHVMTFLEPPEIMRILTMPLSKEWRQTFSSHQDLWRVLCLSEPFKASNIPVESDDDSDDESFCSLSYEDGVNDQFGKYRLMYTSFVRCMRYLSRIKEDSLHGRQPSVIDYGGAGFPKFGASKTLKKFLARTGRVINKPAASNNDISGAPIGVSDNGKSAEEGGKKVRLTKC